MESPVLVGNTTHPLAIQLQQALDARGVDYTLELREGASVILLCLAGEDLNGSTWHYLDRHFGGLPVPRCKIVPLFLTPEVRAPRLLDDINGIDFSWKFEAAVEYLCRFLERQAGEEA